VGADAEGARGNFMRPVADLTEWMRGLSKPRLVLVRAMPEVHFSRLSALQPKKRERFLQVAEKSVGGQRPTAVAVVEQQAGKLMRGHALHAEVARSLREVRAAGSYPRKPRDRGPRAGFFGRLGAALRGNANRELAERFATYHVSLVEEITLREDQCIACAKLIGSSSKRWATDQQLLLSWGYPNAIVLFERRFLEWQQLLNHHGRALQRAAAMLRDRADEVRGLQETVLKVPRGSKFEWAEEYFRRPRQYTNEDPEIQVLNRVCSRLELKLSNSCDACFELRPELKLLSYDERRVRLATTLQRAIEVADAANADATGENAWLWPGEVAEVYDVFFQFVVDRRYPQGKLLFEWLRRTNAAKASAVKRGNDDDETMSARASKVPMFTSFFAEMLIYDFALFDPRVLAAAKVQAAVARKKKAEGGGGTSESGSGSPGRHRRRPSVLEGFVRQNAKFADEERWKSTLNQLTESVVYALPSVQTLCLEPIAANCAALDEKWRAQVEWARHLSPADLGAQRKFFPSDEAFNWRLLPVSAEEAAQGKTLGSVAGRPYETAVMELAKFKSSLVPGQMLHALMRAVGSIYVEASAQKNSAKRVAKAEDANAQGLEEGTEEEESQSRIKHALGADDLFPIILFAALHSGVRNMNQALLVAETFGVAPMGGVGEPAYYLCTLSAAVNFACEMVEGEEI